MTALASNVLRPVCFDTAIARSAPAFEPTDAQRMMLDRLRWLAIRARLRAHEDMERACLLLAGCADATFERYGLLFFAGLQHHARHDLTMHRPGAATLTRDEIWLLRLFDAHDDRALFARMMAWHVEPRAQRWMRFLAHELARTSAP